MKKNIVKKFLFISILLMLLPFIILLIKDTKVFEGEQGISFFISIGVMFGMGFVFFFISFTYLIDSWINQRENPIKKYSGIGIILLIIFPLFCLGCDYQKIPKPYLVEYSIEILESSGEKDTVSFSDTILLKSPKLRLVSVINFSQVSILRLHYKGEDSFPQNHFIADSVLHYRILKEPKATHIFLLNFLALSTFPFRIIYV